MNHIEVINRKQNVVETAFVTTWLVKQKGYTLATGCVTVEPTSSNDMCVCRDFVSSFLRTFKSNLIIIRSV